MFQSTDHADIVRHVIVTVFVGDRSVLPQRCRTVSSLLESVLRLDANALTHPVGQDDIFCVLLERGVREDGHVACGGLFHSKEV